MFLCETLTCDASLQRRFKPVPFLGTGAIMQPTLRSSGVWVDQQKDTRARRHPAHTQITAGRATLIAPGA